MPGKVKVKIIACRNLPIMDRSADTTDAYVEIKFASTTFKTDVKRKTLNPEFNTDYYSFEVDDAELQDDVLQIRIMDYDTYSANDAIGKVCISLNPLLLKSPSSSQHSKTGKGSVMSGWIPIYDTMHGIRGEVNLIVKVDLFSDVNKFRQSSCGIQFFYSKNIPFGYHAHIVHGFVEELMAQDDPEYQWIDKLRRASASNEARQVAFLKLAGQVQRKIGLKAIELGANAVVGYTQCFDLEGDVGVVARGIGTAVTLVKIHDLQSLNLNSNSAADNALLEERKNEYFEFIACGNENILNKIHSAPENSNKIVEDDSMQTSMIESISEEDEEKSKSIMMMLEQEDQRETGRARFGFKKIKKFFNKNEKSENRSPHQSLVDLRCMIRKSGMPTKFQRSRSDGSSMTAILVSSMIASGSVPMLLTPSAMQAPEIKKSLSIDLKSIVAPKMEKVETDQKKISFLDGNLLTVPAPGIVKNLDNSETNVSCKSFVDLALDLTSDEEDNDDSDDDESEAYSMKQDPETVSMVVKNVLAQEELQLHKPSILQKNEQTSTGDLMQSSLTSDQFKSVISENDLRVMSLREMNEAALLEKYQDMIPTPLATIAEIRDDSPFSGQSSKAETPQPPQPEQMLQTIVNVYEKEPTPEVSGTSPKPKFLKDLKENISVKFHSLQQKIHMPHFHKGEGKVKHHAQPGLLETALEAILLDKVSMLEAQTGVLPEKSENFEHLEKTTGHSSMMDDLRENVHNLQENVGEKMHHIQENVEEKFHIIQENVEEKFHHLHLPHLPETVGDKFHNFQQHLHFPHVHHSALETSMFGSAMQTMLMDKLNILEAQSGMFKSRETKEGLKAHSSEPSLVNLEHTTLKHVKSEERVSFDNKVTVVHIDCSSKKYQKENIKVEELWVPDDGEEFINMKIDRNMKDNEESKIVVQEGREYLENLLKEKNSLIVTVQGSNPESPISPIETFLQSKCFPDGSTDESLTITSVVVSRSASSVNLNNDESIQVIEDLLKSSAPQKVVKFSEILSERPISPRHDARSISNENLKCSSYGDVFSNSSNYLVDSDTNKLSLHDLLSLKHRTESTSPSLATQRLCAGHARTESFSSRPCQSPAKVVATSSSLPGRDMSGICRRSSDSDLSITPKGNSLCSAEKPQTVHVRVPVGIKVPVNQDTNLNMLEYPFITLSKFPPGFILHLGATVAARSVKLLERVPNPDEPETRDTWWNELRMEIRSHTRSLGCNVVLGYIETTTISEDVCVLSATGTAAVINLQYTTEISSNDGSDSKSCTKTTTIYNAKEMQTSAERHELEKDQKLLPKLDSDPDLLNTSISTNKENGKEHSDFKIASDRNAARALVHSACYVCHIPYAQSSIKASTVTIKCNVCKRGYVPDVLLVTIEMPEDLQVTGRGCLIQASVCRPKRDLRAESNAKEISDGLPFLEYELHRLLINKLKVKGMNAIFGLKASVTVGEKMMALVATGTAVFLAALPPPSIPKIVAGNSWNDSDKLAELQKMIQDTVEKNRETYQIKNYMQEMEMGNADNSDDSEDELIKEIDYALGNKDTCVLEVDDIQDLEVISMLMEAQPPDGFHVVNTQSVPGLHDLEIVRNLQMFTQVWRSKISQHQANSNFSKHFQRLLQTIYFKLRTMVPVAICDISFKLDLPENDEIQLLVTGMALGLGEPLRSSKYKRKMIVQSISREKKLDDDLIFSLEEDNIGETKEAEQSNCRQLPQAQSSPNPNLTGSLKHRKKSPPRARFNSMHKPMVKHQPLKERYGVDLTPLSYVPGGRIDKYLGNLNFFFIRESTSIRENGGICGFVHSFITELLAVVRAHVTSLGGNAMIAYYMTELMLVDNPHKNQAQCVVNVGGDAVLVSYFTEE